MQLRSWRPLVESAHSWALTATACCAAGLSEHDVSSRFWELLEAATTSAQAHAQAVAAGLPFTLTGVRLRGQISPGFSVTFRCVPPAPVLPPGAPCYRDTSLCSVVILFSLVA